MINRYHIQYTYLSEIYTQSIEECIEAYTAEDALVFIRTNNNQKTFFKVISIGICPDIHWLKKGIIRHELGIYKREINK